MASNNTLITFEATSFFPPPAAPARFDVRNGHPVLNFHPSNEEYANAEGVLPRHYSALGITARIMWTGKTSTGAGQFVAWFIRFERHDPTTDLDADSFASGVLAYGTAAAVSGAPAYTDIVFTNAQLDGLLAGEHFRMQVIRVAADTSDNMAGDAELWSVELRET